MAEPDLSVIPEAKPRGFPESVHLVGWSKWSFPRTHSLCARMKLGPIASGPLLKQYFLVRFLEREINLIPGTEIKRI